MGRPSSHLRMGPPQSPQRGRHHIARGVSPELRREPRVEMRTRNEPREAPNGGDII